MYKRLEMIQSLIPKGCILADIGTDHAQLPILVVKEGRCDKVYACDEKVGPLSIAKENIQKENLEDKIITILSDGFSFVPEDANCAVIAGMGFYTARDILENAINRLSSFQEIIVQINLDIYLMRKWISDHHFNINEEVIVSERNKDYEIIRFNTKNHAPLTKEEMFLGPILMKKNSQDILDFYTRRKNKLEKILALKSKDDEGYQFMHDEYTVLTNVLNTYEKNK